MTDTTDIRKRAEHILASMEPSGCTDGNCVLRPAPKGMHTNGGCRCLYRVTLEPRLGNLLGHSVVLVRTQLLPLLDTVDALRKQVEEFIGQECPPDGSPPYHVRLEAEVTRLREALKKYGECRAHCDTGIGPGRSCSCGLAQARGEK